MAHRFKNSHQDGVVACKQKCCFLVSQLQILNTFAHFLLLGGPPGMVHRFKNSHQDGVVAVNKRVFLM